MKRVSALVAKTHVTVSVRKKKRHFFLFRVKTKQTLMTVFASPWHCLLVRQAYGRVIEMQKCHSYPDSHIAFYWKYFEHMLIRNCVLMSNAALCQDAIIGKYTNFSAVTSSGKVKPKEIQKDCPQLDLKRSSLKSRHLPWKVLHTEKVEYIHETVFVSPKGAGMV